jgi:hypothetical protein
MECSEENQMRTGGVYKQAIKRVFMRHYVHQISSDDNDALEFVSSVGDCVVVTLNDDERRELERAI